MRDYAFLETENIVYELSFVVTSVNMNWGYENLDSEKNTLPLLDRANASKPAMHHSLQDLKLVNLQPMFSYPI